MKNRKSDSTPTALRLLKLLWIFIPLVLAAAMYFLLPLFPEFTEHVISRGLFKVFTVPVGFLTSLVPISLTEVCAVLAIPAVVTLVVVFIVRLRKSPDRRRTAVKAGRFLAGFLSIAAINYKTQHGAHYYREQMEQLMKLNAPPAAPPTPPRSVIS